MITKEPLSFMLFGLLATRYGFEHAPFLAIFEKNIASHVTVRVWSGNLKPEISYNLATKQLLHIKKVKMNLKKTICLLLVKLLAPNLIRLKNFTVQKIVPIQNLCRFSKNTILVRDSQVRLGPSECRAF